MPIVRTSGLREFILFDLIIKCLLRPFRVEENVLIACACIPTLGPFVDYYGAKISKARFGLVVSTGALEAEVIKLYSGTTTQLAR